MRKNDATDLQRKAGHLISCVVNLIQLFEAAINAKFEMVHLVV